MFGIGQSKEADPCKWPAGQVERSSQLGDRQAPGLDLPILQWQIGKLEGFDRQSKVRRDELVR